MHNLGKNIKRKARQKAEDILGKVGVTGCPYCRARLEEIAGCAKGGHLYGKTMEKLTVDNDPSN